MALQAEQIVDLVRTTLNELNKGKWELSSMDLTEYVAMGRIFKKKKVMDSGPQVEWREALTTVNTAKMVGTFATVTRDVRDTIQIAKVPWKHMHDYCAWEDHEFEFNSEPARIVDLVSKRRTETKASMAITWETQFWNMPASVGNEDMFGIRYWFPKKTGTPSFQGTVATGYTTVADINPTTYPKHCCWAGAFTNVTKADLIRKMREASTKTNFTNPVPVPEYGGQPRFEYYAPYEIIYQFEEAVENQNDSLGNDIASKDGKTLFRGAPITYVPHLDNDTDVPIYGINWGKTDIVFLRGEYMKDTGPYHLVETQPRVVVVDTWNTANVQVRKRRNAGWVLSKTATNN